jgi:hypothetical protein
MATSLGQAYSILGSAKSLEYKSVREQEEKARKEARKDKYISYFAAPILEGAGKALVSGATDLVSSAFLGDNAKKYFETEEGRIMARKAKAADKIEKSLIKQREQLTVGGRSALENQIARYTDDFRAQLVGQYGDDPKSKELINQLVQGNKEELAKAAEEGLAKLNDVISYAEKSPDLEDLRTRAADSTQFYGQTPGKRVFRSLVSKLTGKDLPAEGAKFILTGSTDPKDANRQIYVDLLGDDFEEDLAEKMRQVETFGQGKMTNIMLAYKEKNPDLFNRLDMAQQQRIDKTVSDIDFNADLSKFKERYKNNPSIGVFLNSKEIQNAGSMEAVGNLLAVKVGSVTNDQAAEFVNTFMTRADTQDSSDRLELAVSRSLFSLDKDTEALKKDPNYIKIQKATKDFMKDSLIPSYTMDLSEVLSGLDPQRLAQFTDGAKRQLAYEYMTYQINENLMSTPAVDAPFLSLSFDTPAELQSTLQDPEAGLLFLREQLDSPDRIEALVKRARSTGAEKEASDSKVQLVDPYAPTLPRKKTMQKFEALLNPALSSSQKEQVVRQGISTLAETIAKQAIAKRHVNDDGTPNNSPDTLLELEELTAELMLQIYPTGT